MKRHNRIDLTGSRLKNYTNKYGNGIYHESWQTSPVYSNLHLVLNYVL